MFYAAPVPEDASEVAWVNFAAGMRGHGGQGIVTYCEVLREQGRRRRHMHAGWGACWWSGARSGASRRHARHRHASTYGVGLCEQLLYQVTGAEYPRSTKRILRDRGQRSMMPGAMAGDRDAPHPDSVEALVSVVERLADDERARTQALTARASTLAGFAGTILAIVAALGREAFKLDLGNVGDPFMRVLFLVSVVALASSATLAIGGVLRARRRTLVGIEAVRQFANSGWVTKEAAAIKHDWLVSLGDTLAQDRANNDRRAQLGEAAAVALLVGLLAVAGQALVLGLDALLYIDAARTALTHATR